MPVKLTDVQDRINAAREAFEKSVQSTLDLFIQIIDEALESRTAEFHFVSAWTHSGTCPANVDIYLDSDSFTVGKGLEVDIEIDDSTLSENARKEVWRRLVKAYQEVGWQCVGVEFGDLSKSTWKKIVLVAEVKKEGRLNRA